MEASTIHTCAHMRTHARHTQSPAAREFLNTLIMRNRAAGNHGNFYNCGDESFCLPEGETSSVCALPLLFFKCADTRRVSPPRTCDDGSDSGSPISPGPPSSILHIKVLRCTFTASSAAGNAFSSCLARQRRAP